MVRWVAAMVLLSMLPSAVSAQGVTIKMSGDIEIPADSVHDGLAMTMNGRIIVNGTLQGDAVTMNGDIIVSGTVNGSVRTLNGNVTLLPTARVEGDVAAVNGRVDQQTGAVVTGRISHGPIFRSEPQPQTQPQPPEPPSRPRWWERRREWRWDRPWPGFFRMFAAWATVGFIALTGLIALVFPTQLRRIADRLSAMPGQAFLAGLAVWVAMPVLAFALALSIIGIPALVFMPVAVAVLVIFGFAASAMLLGGRLGEAIRRKSSPVADTVIGAIVLGILALVPGVGWLATLLAVTWGIGGAVLLVLPRTRPAAPQ